MCHSYGETGKRGNSRSAQIAGGIGSSKLAVMPLVKKTVCLRKRTKSSATCVSISTAKYDEKDSIGKRYRRQGCHWYAVLRDGGLRYAEGQYRDPASSRHDGTEAGEHCRLARYREDRVSITSLLKKDYVILPKKTDINEKRFIVSGGRSFFFMHFGGL